MIKKTLYFGNPAYLSLRQQQMVIKLPEVEANAALPDTFKRSAETTKPIEDIGIVVLDNRRITITQALLEALLENNCAIISCDARSLPVGMMLPLCGNTVQSERFRCQIDASVPLKKQLWQQTMKAKISNQAAALKKCGTVEAKTLLRWADDVRSGDPDNIEGRAAAYYWKNFFGGIEGLDNFTRCRDGIPPNHLLNYGYAILRAVVARALVSSGMLPTLGIHHHNRYNAYCLADDIMEPFRPYIDCLVHEIVTERGVADCELTTDIKARLLSIPVMDVVIGGKRSPLMVGATQTTASLFRCFSGEARKISYPELS